jgi:hypothetical protein
MTTDDLYIIATMVTAGAIVAWLLFGFMPYTR